MKVLILTSETPANIWLVNQLLAVLDVVGTVIERRPLALLQSEKVERRRQMVKRYGLARTINKLVFNKLRTHVLAPREAATVKKLFFPGEAPSAYLREVPTQIVANINDKACRDFIRNREAEVLAVCGTTVIRPEVFSLAPKGAVNIHTGITPEYRSADPIFWALYRGEPEKVGVTIHFIDRGIDTGPIIHQQIIPVYRDDNLATIYARCIRVGAALYTQALAEIADGTVRTFQRVGSEDRAFRSIDLGILQYLQFCLRFRRLVGRLPRENAACNLQTRCLGTSDGSQSGGKNNEYES